MDRIGAASMIFGATYLIYLMFLLVLILVFKGGTKERKAFLLILVGLPVAILLIKFIHLFYFELRPFVALHFTPIVAEATDASFPSRHATIAAIIALSFTWLKSKWAWALLPIMLWIGISRVYVGVHYSWDIAGGFAVAGIAIFLSLILKKIIYRTYFRP